MYNKKLMILNIVNSIISTTEMNFQRNFTVFLDIVCSYKNIKFEKVQPSNGDAKNDGWIPQKKIYFAMFSPSDSKISQIKEINEKLNSDLDGLCHHVYVNQKWGKDIKEFYFIVNTHDKDLPADPNRLLDNTIEEIKNKYNVNFKVEVLAAKEIKKYLVDCEYSLIENISNNLDIYTLYNEFSVLEIMDFIDDYIKVLATKKIDLKKTSYNRLLIEDKIELNNLGDRKKRILNLIDASDKIDKYLEFVNSEGMDFSKYEKVKNYIIQKYIELKDQYFNKDLYDKLIDDLIYDTMPDSQAIILEAIVVNIFIKCDIFRKE